MNLHFVRERLRTLAHSVDSDHRGARAAVAIVLRQRPTQNAAEVLMIQRAEHPEDPWSGHVAFPGGRKDEADASVRETAEREAREEVGLDLRAHGELLWRMPDVPAIARGRRTGLVIAPLVYELTRGEVGDELSFDRAEVAATLWVSLEHLARAEHRGTLDYVYEGRTIALPCVRLEGGRVLWGLTLQMISALFDALVEG
jgi:8-oxo-dGTP pyrophosphatase MutT (NUDIX family)